jgi:hypothetical protein
VCVWGCVVGQGREACVNNLHTHCPWASVTNARRNLWSAVCEDDGDGVVAVFPVSQKRSQSEAKAQAQCNGGKFVCCA